MWRVLKCLEESLAHINGSMKEAPFGVVHALNSGDVVERSEEFYQLLSQYEGQRRSQGPSPWSRTPAAASGGGPGIGSSSIGAAVGGSMSLGMQSQAVAAGPSIWSPASANAADRIEEIKEHVFASPDAAFKSLSSHLDIVQPAHAGIKRQSGNGGKVAVFICAAKFALTTPCNFEVRFRRRKPVSTQSGGAVCGWKVAQTQCRHPDQKVMQWEHSADCMAFAPSRSSNVRGKEIVQNPIAQALVQDNPHITAKGLMDRLSSKSLEHQVRLSPFSCSVCRARVTQSASVCQSLSLSLWFSSSLVLSFSLSFTPVSLSCPFTHTHALALSLFLSLSLSLFLYPP